MHQLAVHRAISVYHNAPVGSAPGDKCVSRSDCDVRPAPGGAELVLWPVTFCEGLRPAPGEGCQAVFASRCLERHGRC